MSGTGTDGAATVPDSAALLAEQVHVQIRERIIAGTYPPGHRLRERVLSEELNVSRIPVREALAELEAAGFITSYPRRGAVVRQLTLRDVNELFDLRLNLEVYAARRAAEVVAGGGDPSGLERLMEDSAAATTRGDQTAITAANTALHVEIIRMSGNSLLQSSMKPLLGRLRWLFALTVAREPDVQCAEHRSLCTAIGQGKPELAAATAYAHIEHGREPSLRGLAALLPPS